MNFGEALTALKEGKKVTRSVWGGYWYLVTNASIIHDGHEDAGGYSPVVPKIPSLIIAVLRGQEGFAPAQPYQEDLLANDWLIIE